MNIPLPRQLQERLEAEVAAGRFTSTSEAIALAVAELNALQSDDLSWAKPFADKPAALPARGDDIAGDDHL